MPEIKKYKVLRPIAISGRLEAGAEVELPEDEANNIGTDFLKEIDETTEEGEEVTGEVETTEEVATTETATEPAVEPEAVVDETTEEGEAEVVSDEAEPTVE